MILLFYFSFKNENGSVKILFVRYMILHFQNYFKGIRENRIPSSSFLFSTSLTQKLCLVGATLYNRPSIGFDTGKRDPLVIIWPEA